MRHGTDSDSGTDDVEEPTRRAQEALPRRLYWWHVPERPSTGKDMLIVTGVWFATLFALAVIIGVIVAVAG